MAPEKSEKPQVAANSCSMDMVDVKALVSQAESKNTKAPTKTKSNSKRRKKGDLVLKFLKSRYMGLVVGPLYGIFVYYYVTYLILSGPPFTVEHHGNTSTQADVNVSVAKGIYTEYQGVEETDLVDRTLR